MNSLSQYLIDLKRYGYIEGNRPIYIIVLKGNYEYKGKYILSVLEDRIYFYQLNAFNKFKKKKANNFSIEYKNLSGYRLEYYKECYKKISLYFNDETIFQFLFLCDCEEGFDNQANAMNLLDILKKKKILQRNKIQEGACEKTISKSDQLFTKEVRSPSKKGLFR